MLPVLKTSEHILDELSNVLQDQRLCEIFNVTTAELGLLRLTVSFQTRHRALLRGTLCPAPCLRVSCCPAWKPEAGLLQSQSPGWGLGEPLLPCRLSRL